MTKQRGRKSAASLSVVTPIEAAPRPSAPSALDDPAARELWGQIMQSRPRGFFSPGDLPLLREYVYCAATLIPRVNLKLEADPDVRLLDARDKLVRQAMSLARSLRLCVSSRTRPDTAKMRDSVSSYAPPWASTDRRRGIP